MSDVHNWCGKLSTVVKSLIGRIEKLEADKGELQAKLAATQPVPQIAPNSYANAVQAVRRAGTAAVPVTLNVVDENDRLRQARARNVLVTGLKLSTSSDAKKRDEEDEAEFERLLSELKTIKPVKIIEIRRLNRRTRTSASSGTGAPTTPPISADNVVLVLESEEQRKDVLANSRKLAQSESFRSVYVRPDRTPYDQAAFGVLLKERNSKNAAVSAAGRQRQFRFAIIGGRVRCLDLSKENSLGRPAFATHRQECEAIKPAPSEAAHSAPQPQQSTNSD